MKNPFCILALLFASHFSLAQGPEDWTWYSPGIFSNSYPRDLQFDVAGNLWMTCGTKLVKFDGTEWTSYDYTDAGIFLNNESLWCFDLSDDQKAWCGTFKHVLEFDLNLHTWTLHSPAGNNPPVDGIDIAVDKENRVWWAKWTGLYEYDGSEWSPHTFFYNGPMEMDENSFLSVQTDEEGNKWLVTHPDLCIIDGGCGIPPGIIKLSDTETVFFPGEILGLPYADDLKLDFNSNGDPVAVVSSGENFVTTYSNGIWSTPEETSSESYVSDIKVANNGRIFLGLQSSLVIGWIGNNIWDSIVLDNNFITQISSLEISEDNELFVAGSKYPPGTGVLGMATLPSVDFRINGNLYADQNFNGIYDSTEFKFKNRIVKTADGERAAFTNNFGRYSLFFLTPGTWSIETLLPPYFSFGDPPDGIREVTLTVQDSIADDINFGLEPDTTAIDLSVTLSPLNNANPGFNVWYVINYKNLAPNVTEAQIVCNFDSLLIFQNSTPAPASINGNQFIFQPPPLNWMEERSIRICFSLPPDSGLIGQILSHDGTISPVNGADQDLFNNTYALRHTITGPLDPNYIAVDPAGEGPLGEISRYTPYLEYTIQFQNVGTDTAKNVVISNPLDEDLDLLSLDVVGYSHDFSIGYDNEERTLQWVFEDIDLVDSLTNEVESNGFIKYRIVPASREAGATLTNHADICFDFNPPVPTNTVINTLVDTVHLVPLEASICPGERYVFAGDTLTESGVYYDTVVVAQAWDTVFALSLTVNPVYEIYLEVGICDGGSFYFGGEELTEEGTYTFALVTYAGCDSIVILTLVADTVYTTVIEVEVCEGYPFIWGGQVFSSSGTYVVTFTSVGGCDSIVTLVLSVVSSFETTVEAAICDGDFYVFGGEQLTVAGIYTVTLQSFTGCDSIVTLELTVFPVYESPFEAEICQGDSVEFLGEWYYETGVYEHTMSTFDGCDSTIFLHLTVHPNYTTTFEATICEGGSYDFYGEILTMPGEYTHHMVSAFGCDSILVLDLEVLPEYETHLEAEICQGSAFDFNGTFITEAGTYWDSLVSVNGCDSAVVLTLIVHPSFAENFSAVICEGESYEFNGEILTEPGIYSDTLFTFAGCDSIQVLDLEVLPKYETSLEAQICQGSAYDFNGTFLTEAGTYWDSLVSVNGCDSTVVLTLTVHPSFVENLSAVICEGESFEFNGEILTETGIYADTLQTIAGCDSILILDLEVLPKFETSLEAQICQGSAYDFNGVMLTEAGAYVDTLAAITGCDSVLVLDLTVHPYYTENFSAAICEGEAYLFNGEILTETGIYSDTLFTVADCDSIQVLELDVNPVYQTPLEAEINSGETYEFGDEVLTESGIYYDTLLTAEGCDSVLVLTLTVITGASEPLNSPACDYSLTSDPDFLVIQFSSPGSRTVTIFDLNGRPLKTVFCEESETSINLGDLVNGVYIVSVNTEGCYRERARLVVRLR